MNRTSLRIRSFCLFAVLCLAVETVEAQVNVNQRYILGIDGAPENPIPGVTLNIDGTTSVYTFPGGLNLNAGAEIFLTDPDAPVRTEGPVPSVRFEIQGDLNFNDTNAFIDVFEGDRGGANSTFTLNLNGNSITSVDGGGKIQRVRGGEDGMDVTINDANNITMEWIDLTHGDSAPQTLNVNALGAVDIFFVSSADTAAGGNNAGDINISASAITIEGGISANADRTGSPTANGNINLTALATPGLDPFDGENNTADNRVVLGGLVKTNGSLPDQPESGNLNIQTVQLVLNSDFSLDLDESATANIQLGQPAPGQGTSFLFQNMSSELLLPVHDVQWQSSGGPLVEGDINLDGSVDLADFAIIRDNQGTGASFEEGDINFDGSVDLRDFLMWRRLFEAAPGAAEAAVPEPSTLMLAALAVLGMLMIRRWRS